MIHKAIDPTITHQKRFKYIEAVVRKKNRTEIMKEMPVQPKKK